MGEHGANPIAWPDWQDDKRPVRSVCVSMMCWCHPLSPTHAENGLAPHLGTLSLSLEWKYSVFLYHTAIRIRIWIICSGMEMMFMCCHAKCMRGHRIKVCGKGKLCRNWPVPEYYLQWVSQLSTPVERGQDGNHRTIKFLWAWGFPVSGCNLFRLVSRVMLELDSCDLRSHLV